MRKLFIISTGIYICFLILFSFNTSIAVAFESSVEVNISEGEQCGNGGPYTGKAYEVIQKRYNNTSVKCASDSQCLPIECIFGQKVDGKELEGQDKVGYGCISPNGPYKQLDAKDIELCVQNKENEYYTRIDCTQKAEGLERGIFTKGLSPECFACGICSQKDVFQEVVNIIAFIYSIVGGLAVIVLIIGAIMYITAAGSSERVQLAKRAITSAIIGLIIVLVAVVLINAVLGLLGIQNTGSFLNPTLK